MDGPSANRILYRLLFVVIGVVVIAILYLAKVLFVPLAFAILFAFLLFPIVAWLERIRLPRTLAALVVIFGFFALLCAGTWLLFSQLVAIANDLPTYRANIQQKLADIKSPSNSAFSRARQEVEKLGNKIGFVRILPGEIAPNNQSQPLGESPQHPVEVREISHETASLNDLGGAVEPLVIALLTVVFTFFVMLQREDLRNRLIRLSGDRNLTVVTEAMDDASLRISRYFALLLSVNTVYGLVIFGALWLLGLPHAFLFGALAGILRFIPYIGPPIATALPTLLSLAVFHGWEKSLIIIGIFACLEIVTADYAEPRIYGRHTGLSSLAVLVAAAFWTLLWGPIGLLLSVPLTVCLVVMGHHVPSLDFLTVMLGDQPAMPSWACFYQRLLAHDEREAGEILESCASNKTLPEIFDSVLVPALVMSEEDRLHRDLDESTVQSIRASLREIVEEFQYREKSGSGEDDFRAITPAPQPGNSSLKVMSLPVQDETDELAALMLSAAMESSQIRVLVAPVRHLDETMESVANERPDIVVLTGLPPFSFARSHRIYRHLRARFPLLRIMAGIWNHPEDPAEAARKIGGGDPISVFTRIADAVAEIRAAAPSSQPAPGDGKSLKNQNAA
jgi:predicted PurR-regulated permease PerM